MFTNKHFVYKQTVKIFCAVKMTRSRVAAFLRAWPAIEQLIRERRSKKRKMSSYLKQKQDGFFKIDYHRLREKANHRRFFKLLRLFPNEFDYLLELLGDRLEPTSNNISMRTPEKLFLTLM